MAIADDPLTRVPGGLGPMASRNGPVEHVVQYLRTTVRAARPPSPIFWKNRAISARTTEPSAPRVRDAFWFGLFTGMRLGEVLALAWERVDMADLAFRVEDTKSGAPLELPVTRQLAAILERRRPECAASLGDAREWVFPSFRPGAVGHIADLSKYYRRIGETGGARFCYHGLRNVFITVAERHLLLPHSLTKRLVNAAPPDVTEGYAADWTIGQLHEPAQRIADRIHQLLMSEGEPGAEAA